MTHIFAGGTAPATQRPLGLLLGAQGAGPLPPLVEVEPVPLQITSEIKAVLDQPAAGSPSFDGGPVAPTLEQSAPRHRAALGRR